jgi:hypothetical protein
MEQTSFRDIIRKPTGTNPSSSFFACKDIWQDFVDQHFEIVESATEIPVQDIIDQNPGADLTKLLRARDNAWIEQVRNKMNANYNDNKDRLNSRQAAGAPAQLLQKALFALASVDTTQDTFKHDPAVKVLLKQLEDALQSFNNQLE